MIDAFDRETVADDCAREPIAFIGHIQPHGVLFALHETALTVEHVSANSDSVLGLAPDSVLGGPFENVLGPGEFERFRSSVDGNARPHGRPLRLQIGNDGPAMNCSVHRSDGLLVVECERANAAQDAAAADLAGDIQRLLARMEESADIVGLSGACASEMQRLSGFDRVMVYRFDEEWNGEVIAEATRDSPALYLGLRFPASDIPAQARRLFLANPLRAIADAEAAPVAIVPEIGAGGKPLDLTLSVLRSSSPVHLQYLRNMQVRASLTVSIIVRDRLWGMIACHSAAPRPVDFHMRSTGLVVGRILASQIAPRIDNHLLQARLSSRKLLESYIAGIEASTSLFGAQPFQSARLLELFDADGLLLRIDQMFFSQGTTVPEAALLPVIGKLRKFASRGIASSNALSFLDSSAEAYLKAASGALYIGLSEETDEYLLLLRRELVETVVWAGNPDKAVAADDTGRLHPRTSFAAWQETVRGRTRPWSDLELESARFLREQLFRVRSARQG